MRKSIILLTALVILLTGCGEQRLTVEAVSMQPIPEDTNVSLQRKLARWYNVNLISDTPEEGFEQAYSGILWHEGGIMGYIEIPSLELILPILHEGGSGGFIHDARSAFPIGGRGNHTVLTCDALLALGEGEEIRIWILGESRSYIVGQVGDDSCTLICDGTEYICGRPGKD